MGGFGSGYGMMDSWGGGTMFPFSGTVGLLILGLIIVAVVWLVRAVLHPRELAMHNESHSDGLDVLGARYARGEISREEYLRKRADVAS